jgi:hypothetical protein
MVVETNMSTTIEVTTAFFMQCEGWYDKQRVWMSEHEHDMQSNHTYISSFNTNNISYSSVATRGVMYAGVVLVMLINQVSSNSSRIVSE